MKKVRQDYKGEPSKLCNSSLFQVYRRKSRYDDVPMHIYVCDLNGNVLAQMSEKTIRKMVRFLGYVKNKK